MNRILNLIIALLLIQGCVSIVPDEELATKTHRAQELLDRYNGNNENIVQAAELIDEVLKIQPDYVPAYIQAARATIKGGHIVSYEFTGGTLELAEKILLQARELQPDYADVYELLGNVYFLEGRMDTALEALDKATQLKSSNPFLHINYGSIYQKLQKYELADQQFQLVVDLGPGSSAQQRNAYVGALQHKQWLAALRDDNAEVLRLGKMATDAAPADDAWTWGNVANVLFIQGYFDESIEYSRKALSIMNYGVGRNTLALGLYGKWASLVAKRHNLEAEKYFDEAYSLNSDLASVVKRFRHSAKVVARLTMYIQSRQARMGVSGGNMKH